MSDRDWDESGDRMAQAEIGRLLEENERLRTGMDREPTITLDDGRTLTMKQLWEENERLRAPGCRCQECGEQFFEDVNLPDELWNRIRPEGKPEGAGLLCGRCIGKCVAEENERLRKEVQRLTDVLLSRHGGEPLALLDNLDEERAKIDAALVLCGKTRGRHSDECERCREASSSDQWCEADRLAGAIAKALRGETK